MQRQQQREAESLEGAAASMQHKRLNVIAARRRLGAHRTIATQEQLATVSRHLETILAAETVNPETGEVSTVEQTKRVASLVDLMGKDGQLTMELTRAADTFRELFLTALGPSKGISSYGEYSAASEPSGRLPATDSQMKAKQKLEAATVAAFGVKNNEGRWVVDEQLMHLVIPAMLSDKKTVTQGHIGEQRGRYTDKAMMRAVGGTVVHEVLERLSLHFAFRER
jgi:hypothetical protein